jgi:GT2 family glycosyltransferase
VSDTAQIAATVVTHGPDGEYGPLIESLVAQGVAPGAITLIQNPVSPSDPTPEPPVDGVVVLRTERNLAYAGATNVGVRHHLAGDSRYILCLSQDLRLREGAVAALLAAMETAPGFGVLAPVLWLREGDQVFSYGGRRGRRHGWVEHITERPEPSADGIAECDWADGAALLVRHEVFEQIGGLEERLAHYFEETTFQLRARRAGWRVGVVLGAVAEQRPGQAARPAFHAYMISRNGFEYARMSSGLLGVAATASRALRESWELGRSYPAAGPGERAVVRTRLAATWLGFVDFALRRFGPPPDRIRRLNGA